MALWETDDIGPTELSARVKMPLGELTPILDDLDGAALVEQQRHRLTRRVVRVALTDRGRLMEERAVVAQHQVRCQTKLSTGDLQQLRGSLHDLTDTLEGQPTDRTAAVDGLAS